MSEKKIVIREIDDPAWKEKVRREALGSSFTGGSATLCSLPEVRNPTEVNFTSVEAAKITGEARLNTGLTK